MVRTTVVVTRPGCLTPLGARTLLFFKRSHETGMVGPYSLVSLSPLLAWGSFWAFVLRPRRLACELANHVYVPKRSITTGRSFVMCSRCGHSRHTHYSDILMSGAGLYSIVACPVATLQWHEGEVEAASEMEAAEVFVRQLDLRWLARVLVRGSGGRQSASLFLINPQETASPTSAEVRLAELLFICHPVSEEPLAERLRDELGQIHVAAWMCSIDRTANPHSWSEILLRIRASRAVAVLLSKDAVQSEGQRRELQLALRNIGEASPPITTIPVVVDHVDFSPLKSILDPTYSLSVDRQNVPKLASQLADRLFPEWRL